VHDVFWQVTTEGQTLGQGSFGQVRVVLTVHAAKYVRPGLPADKAERARQQLENEAQLLARLRGSELVIAPLLWVPDGTSDGRALVMEYAPLGALDKALARWVQSHTRSACSSDDDFCFFDAGR
jgi:serine/threonine protein kinase